MLKPRPILQGRSALKALINVNGSGLSIRDRAGPSQRLIVTGCPRLRSANPGQLKVDGRGSGRSAVCEASGRISQRGFFTQAPAMTNSKKNHLPDRWTEYSAVGKRIPGTRFVAFKVPLRQAFERHLPPEMRFCPQDLVQKLGEQNQELGLIIDLTFTTRYYQPQDLPESLFYLKIFTAGHEVPCDATILKFKQAVRRFLQENEGNDKLIGVHCTHGLNRTGYLICRYLIDVAGMDPAVAIKLFNKSRGHSIERQNYIEDLQNGPKRSNKGISLSVRELEPVRGQAVLTEDSSRFSGAAPHTGRRLPPGPCQPPYQQPPPFLCPPPPPHGAGRWPSRPSESWRTRQGPRDLLRPRYPPLPRYAGSDCDPYFGQDPSWAGHYPPPPENRWDNQSRRHEKRRWRAQSGQPRDRT
ncbi:RNA/RNP complex-1-interacting phosphatase-like [Polyodon spathula]|uniref:RNA/RNP complex-1-interacting phosphatase-like n=1 Tax=Polyodon spathula TaxID=7913 RepID=UPI001B7E386E|nr:RNA/RNP complex-1-interacting phosphatase-like [Polyodon spathula]